MVDSHVVVLEQLWTQSSRLGYPEIDNADPGPRPAGHRIRMRLISVV